MTFMELRVRNDWIIVKIRPEMISYSNSLYYTMSKVFEIDKAIYLVINLLLNVSLLLRVMTLKIWLLRLGEIWTYNRGQNSKSVSWFNFEPSNIATDKHTYACAQEIIYDIRMCINYLLCFHLFHIRHI